MYLKGLEMPTTVISVRGRDRDALLADPDFVYVGRACYGWPASRWGNPSRRGMTPREAKRVPSILPWGAFTEADRDEEMTARDLVECYRKWLAAQPPLRAEISGLVGKRLGCWCGSWEPGKPEILCHAVVLAKAANALEQDPPPCT